MAAIKHKSRILAEMHETAQGLHSAGRISKRRMAEFDALCDLGVDSMPPEQIKSLREHVRLSQAVFAAVLNISLSTVQKWEAGDKKPSGPALKLLNLIERKGLDAVL
ncbi:helix-turn-helix domain-containing protein [Rugamonas apoptosis]|uniref:DNA-binding transcriptional regulator n=1 Tax=Rugamonas apoptosis TaxID=2758570 RepID=A0A7W2IIZ1_9BURK|nr:DNA-binding transcriptional regulator [Rugamonas apoptosis]MBA5685802.1 DNA-binding transcriptional regulator [Rugamonas apoptosis]